MSILTKPITAKRYLTFLEVQALYGIGRKAVARLVRERQLRRQMVGRAWRYPVADLEAIFSADTRDHRRRDGKRRNSLAWRYGL